MDDVERKLIHFGSLSISTPDSDRFILRLHREIKRLKDRQRGIQTAGLTMFLITLITAGLFEGLWLGMNMEYSDRSGFQFLSELVEDEYDNGTLYDDEVFILDAADYLILEMDYIGTMWEIVPDLENLGITILNETNRLEKL